MISSFVREGVNLEFQPRVSMKAGDIVFLGSLCAHVTNDVPANQLGTARIAGVIRIGKALTAVMTVGAEIHYDSATRTGVDRIANGRMGIAVGGGVKGQDYVEVLLNAPVPWYGLNVYSSALPTVTVQPVNQTVSAGQPVKFVADMPDARWYQWMVSTDAGANWVPIDGAEYNELTIDAVTAADNGKQFQCIIVNVYQRGATSVPATLTVV